MLELFVLNQSVAKIVLNGNYSDVLPAAFTLTQRALAAAEIFARPAALIADFFLTTGLAAVFLPSPSAPFEQRQF